MRILTLVLNALLTTVLVTLTGDKLFPYSVNRRGRHSLLFGQTSGPLRQGWHTNSDLSVFWPDSEGFAWLFAYVVTLYLKLGTGKNPQKPQSHPSPFFYEYDSRRGWTQTCSHSSTPSPESHSSIFCFFDEIYFSPLSHFSKIRIFFSIIDQVSLFWEPNVWGNSIFAHDTNIKQSLTTIEKMRELLSFFIPNPEANSRCIWIVCLFSCINWQWTCSFNIRHLSPALCISACLHANLNVPSEININNSQQKHLIFVCLSVTWFLISEHGKTTI